MENVDHDHNFSKMIEKNELHLVEE